MSDYPYQGTNIKFDYTQSKDESWLVEAKFSVKRSKDGKTWEVALVSTKVFDKDYANAIMTCWEVFNNVQHECDGDLFEYKHSEIYKEEI